MVVTGKVTYDVDGTTMVAHLAHPDGNGPWPAVLVAHDGVGLDDYQRSRADDLAAHGYLALAMDYHGGRTFFGEPRAMLDRVMPMLADPGRMRALGRSALDVLLAVPGVDHDRLLALGYGAGGRIVLELVSAGVPFRALAAIHPGLPVARADDWRDVGGAVLLCTGSEDPICSPGHLSTFAGALQEAGVDWRMNVYGGAEHAFWSAPTHPDGSSTGGTTHVVATVPGVGHHPLHAKRAWRAVLDLFEETVGRSSGR